MLRPACCADAQIVDKIDRTVFGYKTDLDYPKVLKQGWSFIFEVDGKNVAHIIVSGTRRLFIESLAVMKRYRGRGFAHALRKFFSNFLKTSKQMTLVRKVIEFGMTIKLVVEDGNSIAFHLYEKNGFQSFGDPIKNYFYGKDGIKMVLNHP